LLRSATKKQRGKTKTKKTQISSEEYLTIYSFNIYREFFVLRVGDVISLPPMFKHSKRVLFWLSFRLLELAKWVK